MNSSLHDLDSSTGITQMPGTILESTSNQPLITTDDINISNQDNTSSGIHFISFHPLFFLKISNLDPLDNVPLESKLSNIAKKQKSLVSIYDNSNDGEQQQQQQLNQNSFPIVGILGRNQRSEAFTKRLLLSGFPNPILCDINSNEFNTNENSNYVSYETFYEQSPSIILITDNLTNNFEYLFNQDQQQLIIDARELICKYFSKKSPHLLLPIPESYRAFGNLSNWEIENGTQRVAVAIEQSSPINLIKFIHNLNCFSRGIYFVDPYTYNNEQIKSFRNCLFPFISTIIIFSLCLILSMIEYNNHENYSSEEIIYRQSSSITASTSLTILSFLLLIRPVIELIEFILKKRNKILF